MYEARLSVKPRLPLAVRLHQETDWGTNDHTAPHMHLPVVTWFFWSHGFHGNRAIVLTGNEEGCISSLLHYTTTYYTHTHTHTLSLLCHFRYEIGVVLWGKGDGWLILKQQLGHSRSIKCPMENWECWLTFWKLSPACVQDTQLPATLTPLQIMIRVWEYKVKH